MIHEQMQQASAISNHVVRPPYHSSLAPVAAFEVCNDVKVPQRLVTGQGLSKEAAHVSLQRLLVCSTLECHVFDVLAQIHLFQRRPVATPVLASLVRFRGLVRECGGLACVAGGEECGM